MNNSENPEMVSPQSTDSALAEFDGKKDLLATFCAKTKGLIEELLDNGEIRYQSVQARVKSRKKLEEKYSDPKKKYRRLDDITDLAALRIITYYEDEVDIVAELIRSEFQVDPDNSVDRRISNVDSFGYHAINFVCRYSEQRLGSSEYRKYTDINFEIQITSILRHAWAEIEHDWYDMKDAFPTGIRRRFSRMAALIEIAESEFLELKKTRDNYKRSISVQIEANVSGIPINAVSMASFIEKDPVVLRIDTAIAQIVEAPSLTQNKAIAEICSQYVARLGIGTIENLRDTLSEYESEIVEYAALSRQYLARRPGAALVRGASIIRMTVMLLGIRGSEELVEVWTKIDANFAIIRKVDFEALSELAKAVLATRIKKV
jgi:putative GTP pyrophosphokinase